MSKIFDKLNIRERERERERERDTVRKILGETVSRMILMKSLILSENRLHSLGINGDGAS